MKQFTFLLIILIPILVYSQIRVFEEQTIFGQFSEADYSFQIFTAGDIDHDDKIDILFIKNYQIVHYEQENIASNEFTLMSENFFDIPMSYCVAELIDLDFDGNLELLTGNSQTVNINSQTDANTYNYSLQNTTMLLPPGENYNHLSFEYRNINNMANPEMIVGGHDMSPSNPGMPSITNLFLFRYAGGSFILLDDFYTDTSFVGYAAPTLTYYDHDDQLDLLVGSSYHLYYFEQEYVHSLDFEIVPTSFENINFSSTIPFFCDVNNDGIDDLLLGTKNPYEIRIFIRKLWADFSFESLSTNTYQFNCESIGEIETYQWDFNDDGIIDSNEENPLWIYDEPSFHTVSLEIINGIYHDINEKEIEIQTGLETDLLSTEDTYLTAYPNPFNPTTTISFQISEFNAEETTIEIYNIKGQKVKQFSDLRGQTSVLWNGDDESENPVSSGIYLYKLNVNGKTEAVKKCLLLK